jgi:serine/threonine protein kinase
LVETEAKRAIDVGSIIDDCYEIISCIGRGGMGVVYKAKDLRSGKLVALKLLFPERIPDLQAVARFNQEVRAASLLDHPALAKVYSSGVAASGQPYFVMDFIDGTTLGDKIAREGQLPIEETLEIFIQVCDGLAHAHQHHILHRDLKPSNIMLTTGGDCSSNVKILDFGLAKFQGASEKHSLHLTSTGQLVGSPFYMSPEQARGATVDERSDLYSLGCTMYEALTGGPPHVGMSPLSTILKRETHQPLPLSEGSLGRRFPQRVEKVSNRLLNIDPKQRYQSAVEVKEELLKLLNSDTLDDSPAADSSVPPPTPTQQKYGRNRGLILTGIVIAASTIVFIGGPYLYAFTTGTLLVKPPSRKAESPTASARMVPFDWPTHELLQKGAALRETEQFDDSARAIQEAITQCKRSLGPNTAQLVDAYRELADTYVRAHKQNDAYKALKIAFPISEKLPDYTDLNFAPQLQKLAKFYGEEYKKGKAGSRDKAMELYEHAASLYLRPWYGNNIEAGRCLFEVGQYLTKGGQYVEAEEKLNAALELFSKQPCSPDHSVMTLRCLALDHRHQKKYNEARECDSRALDLIQHLDHTEPENTTNTLNELASDFFYLSNGKDRKLLKDAESFYNQSRRLCQQYPQMTRAPLMAAYQGLGDVYLCRVEKGARDKARRYYETVVSTYKSSPPSSGYHHIDVTYQKLGLMAGAANDLARQLQYFDLARTNADARAKEIVEEQVANATIYRYKQNRSSCSEALCKPLLVWCKQKFGSDSVECADVYAELGRGYLTQQKSAQARAALETAHAVYTKVLGPMDPKTKIVAEDLTRLEKLIEKPK